MAGGIGHDAILAGPETRAAADERGIAAAFHRLNDLMFKVSAVALIVAAVVLTGGVIYSHITHRGVVWQDEVTIYLIAGAIFLSAAAVQSKRGHIGIEVLDHLLPARANAARRTVIDALVLTFCVFFAWKSGLLLHEAWTEGQTSQSQWGPPLWIPYLVLTVGMVLLALQVAFQVGQRSLILLMLVFAAAAGLLLWQRPAGKLISDWPQWQIGVAYCVATLVTMFSGMPIAFALGSVAVIVRQEIVLAIMGGVFVAEAVSVMLQVMYFKYTRRKYGAGRRLFMMAPLHHHFEKRGWKETQVVVRFWIITMLLCLLGLSTLKLR